MEDYKQYLNDNADEAEHRAAQQVMEGLAGLRLEAKVREVAAERAALHRRVRWQRFLIASIALILMVSAVYLFFGKKDANVNTPAAPTLQQRNAPQLQTEPQQIPSEQPKDQPAKKQPIAQLRPAEQLPNPRYPAPEVTMIRGNEADNKALKSLLDQVWYTDYPLRGVMAKGIVEKADKALKKRDFSAAYLELERLSAQNANNDTLRYLKGYCLLQMGEGAEAFTYFKALQGRHKAWDAQLEWYSGLALLLLDEREKAKALLQQIVAQNKHPYRRQAEKAAGLLQQ
jgi:tetratricopeptide (TPR) repeat protein